ncbi:MAG: ATP synthase F0F1 subunit epsilon [Candidatus Methanoperedens nitroreducens]|uniref:ATP synthase F0F1 subunit epsilon n=1 Tax=Candidatus Methanoperedens nitratireducens TaxID=1392998 RepID=A0A0N8KR68_9EURY|nr:MAG: ATP synthase F0F1 subunit epsilon [Candidatus Methanoperedens sp. BLZ1]MCX9087996.1 F0F1 ATP synthase subunit epsilon [Candidatus Methanoperedens sp.]
MRLKIMLPTRVLIDQDVTKVVAEAENGSFGILPKHIDFVTALVSGILSFEYDNKEEFLAVDEGILVKWGSDVFVSTRNAVRSKDLGRLKQTVKEEFHILDEREKKSRSVIARLEADFAKRILELE